MRAGQQLSKYQLRRRLGGGGIGEVFLAVSQGALGVAKTVVIKCLRPEHREDEELVQMFLDEARIAARLSHNNVCQAIDLGQHDGEYFMVVEFIDGPTVSRIARTAREQQRPIPLPVAAFVAKEIAAGLHYIHTKEDTGGEPLKIIHRDISPQNVLVSREGAVKIIDLGIAKSALAEHRSRHGVVKGKFRYMSPEQARGEPLDPRVDIYACGVLLHELIGGRRRGEGLEGPELRGLAEVGDLAKLSELRREVPPALEAIVARATAKGRDARHATAAELEQELAAWIPLGFTRQELLTFIDELGLFAAAERAAAEEVEAATVDERPLSAIAVAPTVAAGERRVPATESATSSGAEPAAPAGERRPPPETALASVLTELLPARPDEGISELLEGPDPLAAAATAPGTGAANEEPGLALRTPRRALVRAALVTLLVVAGLVGMLLMVFDRPGASPAARSVLSAPSMATLVEGYRRALQAEDHEAAVVLFQRMTALGHPAARRRGEQLAYRSSLREMIAGRRAQIEALVGAGACERARQQAASVLGLRATLADPDEPDPALPALVASCRPAPRAPAPRGADSGGAAGAVDAAQTTRPAAPATAASAEPKRGRRRAEEVDEETRNVRRLLALAKVAYEGGQHRRAHELAQRVLRIRPADQEAWQLVGVTSCYLGRRAEAGRALAQLTSVRRQMMLQVCHRVGVSPTAE